MAVVLMTNLDSAAMLERTLGRVDEAIDLYRRTINLDPIFGHRSLGTALYLARRYEEAADSLQMALSLNPDAGRNHYRLSLTLLAQGDATAALDAAQQEPIDVYRLTGTAVVYYALGDAGASEAALKELIERFAAGGGYQIAEAYAYRGEIDDAFEWLEHAYENRDSGMISLLLNPLLANLHSDPRWEPLLDKVGLPH